MAFTDKDEAVSKMNSNITSSSDPHLTPSGGDNKVRATNLKQWLNEFLDWILPTSASDLKGKTPVVTATGNNYSTITWQKILPIGTILPWGGSSNTPPDGFLFCDGSEVSTTTYSDLYAVIGTNYNNGSVASGTFRTPNLSNKVPLGFSEGDSTTPDNNPGVGQTNYGKVGNRGGDLKITLSDSNLPSHTHSAGALKTDTNSHSHAIKTYQDDYNEVGGVSPSWADDSGGYYTTHYTQPSSHSHYINGNTGGKNGSSSSPIENRMRYMVVKYIIKT